jgi:hypothetical protein
MEKLALRLALYPRNLPNSTDFNMRLSQAIDYAILIASTPFAPKADQIVYGTLLKLVENKCF